ncbi:Apolipoprotein N-acyltransferase [Pseudomonas aeruginosa]|nr:Apolipoprotein N-acyltransferase [Pseudomonas aeruginosa]
MRWISRPGWPGHLLALAAGALTPLALAPFDYWPLAILSIALLYLGLRGLPGKSALWRGWWYGFGAFGAGTSWIYVSIHDYGAASVPLASFLMLGFTAGVAFFFALPAWLWARCLRRDNAPLGDALAFAALWLALELFRSWFLTGFPWLYAGYSQLQGPLAGLVPVGGVWLSSFVIALSAALLVNLPRLFPHGASLLLGLVLLLGPWAAGLYLKGHAWTHSAGEPLKVVAIQGNIAQELKWDPNQVRAQLDLYRDLSLPQQDVDLIVWPETSSGAAAIADQADRLVQQHAALPEGLRFRQPAAEGPQVGPAEEADRRRDHLEPLALEAPACPLHVPGLGHQHHPAHAGLAQLRGAQGGVFPGGTAETFLPARRHAEVLQQGIGHQRRLAGRASVMQPAADQYRQRRGLGQPRGIAQPLGRQQARRIVAPGRVVGLPAGTEDDDGVGALRQARQILRQ